MSKWTHAICGECWKKVGPDREPVKIIEVLWEKCCFCGKDTREGIYIRHDPQVCLCKGEHDDWQPEHRN